MRVLVGGTVGTRCLEETATTTGETWEQSRRELVGKVPSYGRMLWVGAHAHMNAWRVGVVDENA